MNESPARQEIFPAPDLNAGTAAVPPLELVYPRIRRGLLGRRDECGRLATTAGFI